MITCKLSLPFISFFNDLHKTSILVKETIKLLTYLGYNWNMDLKQLKTQFLEYLEIEKNRSPKTTENYDHYLHRFFDFAKVSQPQQITEELIRKFRLHLNRLTDFQGSTLKKVTQNYHIIALRAFLKYLAKREIKSVSAEKIEL